MKKRYEVGLEKLATTESSVADMQQELIALQPQLEVSTKETEAAMVVSYLSRASVSIVTRYIANHQQGHKGHKACDVTRALLSPVDPVVTMHGVLLLHCEADP